jgi:hypothetical protein
MKAVFRLLSITFAFGVAVEHILSTPKEKVVCPLLIEAYVETIKMGPYPETIIATDEKDRLISSNTYMLAKVIVGYKIKNASSNSITLSQPWWTVSWDTAYNQQPDVPDSVYMDMICLSSGGYTRSPPIVEPPSEKVLFSVIAPGNTFSTDTSEIYVPLNSTTLHYQVSCGFDRDGVELGLNAWTGTVISAEYIFPLAFTNEVKTQR